MDVGGLAKEIVVERHDRKSRADDDRVDPSDGIDERGIFFMGQTQGLEGTLKTMDQVHGQGQDANEVDNDDP